MKLILKNCKLYSQHTNSGLKKCKIKLKTNKITYRINFFKEDEFEIILIPAHICSNAMSRKF